MISKIVELGSEFRAKTAPEKEYLISAFACVVYLTLLLRVQIELGEMEEVFDWILNTMPGIDFSLSLLSIITFVGVVDGACRITTESLPLYKAWLQVFVLQTSNEKEE